MLLIALLVAGASPALSARSAAQSPPTPTGPRREAAATRRPRLLGVYDASTGLPLEGVEVIDVISDLRVRTDAAGAVPLNWLTRWKTTDSAAVQVRKLGYAEQQLVLLASDTADVSVGLERLTGLAAVTTTAAPSTMESRSLEPFETRRKMGAGKFVTTDDLIAGDRTGLGLHDLLAKHGIVLCGPTRARRGSRGPVITYVDGVQQALRDTTAGTVSATYAAFEFYSAATVPAQYNATGREACGYLLAWTRR